MRFACFHLRIRIKTVSFFRKGCFSPKFLGQSEFAIFLFCPQIFFCEEAKKNGRKTFAKKITELCEARDMRALAGLLEELNPVDIAEALDGLSMRDTALVYRILPKEKGGGGFC